ncbi:hypothetical protein A0H81_09875 [Grifola frondosa]|uniref:Uncharacterized protein n=1 Tax=Grifola frondosa TaxID=5627 RepID=A0A1C7M523_GRIFR|nr:hypothetical protein A0H81_09875 [Grifola frondosa]
MLCTQRHPRRLISCFLLLLILCCPSSHAQAISTSTPIPPLQWINLSGLLTGSPSAPPLKDASIGYDGVTRDLIIFGGESQQGFPTSQTYLLNLETLTWHSPSPPTGLNTGPSVRTASVGGDDFAASNRQGHVVIGGEGSDDSALSDVWDFDYINQFWSQVNMSPGGPSARWGAVGGIDIRVPFIQDPVVPGPNRSLYLAGGYDGKTMYPLSDRFGQLGANYSGQFKPSVKIPCCRDSRISADRHHRRMRSIANITNSSCALQDSFIIDTVAGTVKAPSPCPAPRLDGTVVPNFNGVSSNFASQAFLLFGTFNSSLWDDGGGLERGEVAVLDVGTAAWTRVLPAGDPGSTTGGTPAYPSPREGAVAIASANVLVGSSTNAASDTIIFGGRDASGQYLSEVWLLRAYNATLTQTNQSWSGFGNGELTGGKDANGAGVTVQYMTECASAITGIATQSGGHSSSTTATSGPSSSTGTGSSSSSSASAAPLYDTSTIHKSLAPVSVALFMPAVVFFRLSAPSVGVSQLSERHIALFYAAAAVGLAAYGLGIAGLATSFTSIVSTMSIVKRSSSSSLNLKTAHGRAGIALFIGFYGLVPLLIIFAIVLNRIYAVRDDEVAPTNGDARPRTNSDETTGEKSTNGRTASPLSKSEGPSQETHSEGRSLRVRSWAGLGTWAGAAGRRSSESGLDSGAPDSQPQGSFEVTNRPSRTRRASGNSLAAFSDPRPTHSRRNLSDLSWLDRRRSLNTVGELDLALNQLHRPQDPGTPGTTAMDMMSTSGLMPAPTDSSIQMPQPFEGFIHVLFHAFLLALSILCLVALWTRGPRAAFGVFLAWTVLFYIGIVVLSWQGHPRISILSVLCSRLRADPLHHSRVPNGGTPGPSRPLSAVGSEGVPFPGGPYQHHQPPFRAAADHEYPASLSQEPDADDEEEDEDARQRRIEEEMSRRDVSIVTVPRRRLFLTNPGP